MKKIWWKVLLTIWAAVALLNAAAWNSPPFCDWYIRHIFPFWINTYGRLTGLLPFSAGEIMIILGLAIVIITAVLGLARLAGTFWLGLGKMRRNQSSHPGSRLYKPEAEMAKAEPPEDRKRHTAIGHGWVGFCRGTNACFRYFLYLLTGLGVVMTLNCFILYHGSTFLEKYFDIEDRQYSLEELITLRNFVVEQCNALSARMSRDAEGTILYTGNMEQTAVEAMQKLGEHYIELSGFYPYPKPLMCSDFLSQQYMAGYYFPFSIEANYNNVMYIMNKPATFCHELAHLKGYIYEDEANFIGYLACIQSEDIFFRYSGFLSVLYYLDNDFYDAVGGSREKYLEQVRILPQVHEDNIFLTEEEWERIEGKALLDTEIVDAVSDAFVEASLKLNGVADGMISYSRVVKLLLQYYNIYGY